MEKRILADDEWVTVTRTHYPKGMSMPPHTHDFSAVSFILKGNFQEEAEGRPREVTLSKTLVKPKDFLHSDQYETDCTILCIYLKDETVLSASAREVLKQWKGAYGVNWGGFQSYLDAKDLRDRRSALNTFLQLVQAAHHEEEPPEWLFRLRQQVEFGSHHNLQLQELAQTHGVHPVYLARVFRKYFGLSLKTYLRHVRIRRAMGALANDQRDLTSLAFAQGFADQSHFIRDFRRDAGVTPSQFRKIVS